MFSRRMAEGIYANPIEPARARGLVAFDIGVSLTAVPVDQQWQNSVLDDFSIGDHLPAPRLVVTKGLQVMTISGMYGTVPDTDLSYFGGALDVPIVNGGILRPTLAVRGSYSSLQGADDFELDTYGGELFLSHSLGPVTPYAAIGFARSDGRCLVTVPTGTLELEDEATTSRFTAGLKVSLFIPKIVVEVVHGEEVSFSAKVAFGL